MGEILSFLNADIVESELSRVTTQPVLTQTTGETSCTVPHRIAQHKTSVEGVNQPSVSSFETPALGNITTDTSNMMLKKNDLLYWSTYK